MSDDARPEELDLSTSIRLLSGQDDWHTGAAPRIGLRSMRLSDGPHGLRVPTPDDQDSLPATCFPTAVTLGSTWDRALVEQVGDALGQEAGALGVDVILGPGLNIKRHPYCGRNFEYLSEDPVIAGELAAAMVRGIQGRGVGACVKHFAANNQETLRLVVDAVIDERTLHEIYLSGFERVVRKARPATVMCSYNQINGTAASTNRELLTDTLRTGWGFNGLVMSDWGAVWDRVASLEAGLDLQMPGVGGAFDRQVSRAVASGRLSREAVETSVGRLVALQERLSPARGPIEVEAHDALARTVAAAGTVLASNDGVLPLAAGTKVALIGGFATAPRYQGAGSSQVHPTSVTSLLPALRAKDVEVSFARGYDPESERTDAVLVAEAAELAASQDVAVVIVGLPEAAESEGYDRTTLALPAQHDALVRAVCAANPRTVVIVVGGSSVTLPWADRCAALLLAGLGGQAGGGALADVLVGDAEPSGRLAETWWASSDQPASAPWFPGSGHRVEYREALAVGYRHTTTNAVTPAFAFGHGLSYATFEWSGAGVDREQMNAGESLTATVTVHNTSARAGAEVVEVYLSDRSGVVQRPRRWLAGFEKVWVGAGESVEVQVHLDPVSFAFWDTRVHDWVVPTGGFDVEFGRSAERIEASVPVEVVGGVTSAAEADAPWTPLVCESDEAFTARLGHPVPAPRPRTPYTAESTIEEVSDTAVGAALRAAARRRVVAGQTEPRMRRMLEHMVDELPLRNVPSLSGGAVRPEMVGPLVDAINGPDALLRGGLGRVTGVVGAVLGRLGRPAK